MHIDKFKPTAVRAVIDHDERTHLSTLMRDNIDESRTHLNQYWYGQVCQIGQSMNTYVQEVVKKIEEQNKKKIRKDANLLASICLTLPSSVLESDSERFFVESLNFIRDELRKNGLSYSAPMKAYLHKDETTPHVHLKFVPLLEEEDGKLKLNFKKVCPRKFYQSIHTDLEKHLTPILGYPPKVLLDTNDPLRVLSPESQKRYVQMQAKVLEDTAKITNKQLEEKKKLDDTVKKVEVTEMNLNDIEQKIVEIKKENSKLEVKNKELLDEKKDLGLTLQNLQSQSKMKEQELSNLMMTSEQNEVSIQSKKVILQRLSAKSMNLDSLSLTQLEQELEILERLDF